MENSWTMCHPKTGTPVFGIRKPHIVAKKKVAELLLAYSAKIID